MVDKLVEIADLVIPPNDTSVSGFVYNLIKDWYSGPTGDSQQERRDSGDGYFDEVDMDYNGLVVSFEGVCVDYDKVSLARKKARFAALRNNGLSIPVSVTDPLGKTTRYGKVLSTPIPHTRHLTSFSWAIDILFTDPLRYGDLVSGSTGIPVATGGRTWPATWPLLWGGGGNDGRITLTNEGTAPAWPRFRATGGQAGGFRVSEVGTGKEIIVNRTIPLGSYVDLDSATESATIDGPNNNISGSLSKEEWWSVGPGETATFQFNPLGDVTGDPQYYAELNHTFQ